jgi:hypothetical protein
MCARLSRGVLTISIDLEAEGEPLGLGEQRSLDEMARRLANLLARHSLAATWGAADPAGSAIGERLVSLDAGHEIAVLGDATWIGREAGRTSFGRELARRTARSRGTGMRVSTLMLKGTKLDEHYDLAIKHGITVVRQAVGFDASHASRLQPQTVRFGLWSFPVSVALPGTSRCLPGGGGKRTARATIDRAIAACGLIQLAIDAPRLAARGHAAERVVERVLEHVARRRRQGTLEVVTLSEAAGKLRAGHPSRPSRSILRPAA